MKPLYSKLILLLSVFFLGLTCWRQPNWLSDQNPVLKDFIDIDFSNFLGVILTITIASLSQLNLSLGKISQKEDKSDIADLRSEIKSSAVFLVFFFALGFAIAIMKPLIAETDLIQSIINSLAILIIIFFLLILVDITFAIFDFDE
jgi:hypothetical protein